MKKALKRREKVVVGTGYGQRDKETMNKITSRERNVAGSEEDKCMGDSSGLIISLLAPPFGFVLLNK